MKLHTKLLKWIFRRHMGWRLEELVAPRFPILIQYPFNSRPRYGYEHPPHPEIEAILSQHQETYLNLIRSFAALNERFIEILNTQSNTNESSSPTWFNRFFTGLDAAALYGLIARKSPCRLIEIGSGNSTKFARRAAIDFGHQMHITSIDPNPRKEIDKICDHVIRQPLESIDLSTFNELESGDILFVDNSHCTFMNSDATVVFLDILPRLRPGVIVHIHDILLPFDYPIAWKERYYSEQYLLACYLLGGMKLTPLFPCAYISNNDTLKKETNAIWGHTDLKPILNHALSTMHGFQGFSFWATVCNNQAS